MKPNHIVALGVRLFAIFLFFNTLKFAMNWLPYIGDDKFGPAQGLSIALTIVLLIVILLLWLFPISVANPIVPNPPKEESSKVWSVEEMYGCGFVLLGMYFLFYSVSDGLFWVMHLVVLSRNPMGIVQHTHADTISMIVTVLEVIVSIGIILGSRGLTRLVYKLRYA